MKFRITWIELYQINADIEADSLAEAEEMALPLAVQAPSLTGETWDGRDEVNVDLTIEVAGRTRSVHAELSTDYVGMDDASVQVDES